MVAAERVASTVAQGVHGRRRVGQGESFWQFRPFVAGDASSRIDWRQSAKSDRTFIRETEWEAAQTIVLWRDASASMHWKSRGATVEKVERAGLLLLALASLLVRGGERVLPIGGDGQERARPLSGRAGLDRLAISFGSPDREADGLPATTYVPRHAQVVLFGDFLSPLERVREILGRLAAIPASGHLMQILDPAEAALPFRGRVRFIGLERDGETLVPRAESIRESYAKRLLAHQEGLATIATAAGFTFGVHHTDHPPETALLGLYAALSAR
ncbi:MAG: DUF58 domain-containing protein [Acetobacteraceae bacterium]|nr:DUF58 domain-containing protein [Acetobacteraceae bacterium]